MATKNVQRRIGETGAYVDRFRLDLARGGALEADHR
jgi:hypothetical protein